MKILKHGVCHKCIPVVRCDGCGLIAILNRNEIKKGQFICPECYEEETILFLDKDELKDFKKGIKEKGK